MNGSPWRPQVQKLHIYEGIFNLNRAFHATLLSLERLENLGFFRAEYLNARKIELEHTRANANDELIETLRDYEQDEGWAFLPDAEGMGRPAQGSRRCIFRGQKPKRGDKGTDEEPPARSRSNEAQEKEREVDKQKENIPKMNAMPLRASVAATSDCDC
jgi:hypothetical protein